MPSKLILTAFLLAIAAAAFVSPVARANVGEIQLGPTCVTSECHSDIMEPRFLHGPVNLGECTVCHIVVDDRHEFRPVGAGTDLCMTCHEPEQQMSYVHGPYQSDCALCHDPHGSDNRHFVRGGEGAESCNLCHDSVTEGRSHIHGPVALGECLVCHTPHQSEYEGLLIEPRADLCLGCHVDVEISLANAVSLHEPVSQDCSGCHDPHGGMTEFYLPSEGSELCMSCHGEFIEASMTAEFPHAAMTEGQSCRHCHAPHASPQQALLGQPTLDLCLSCHSEEIHRDDRTVNNIHAELTQSEFLHGPIREDNCVACHQAHGSDVASILIKEFPRDFYAPYTPGAYDLCFECHDRSMIEMERTELTGFRDGDRNLHFVHVAREKGRSCRACHAEHASVQPNHVRTEVPFGRWMMPVRFEKFETGGTCETGCHIPYQYDRLTPELESQ